MHRPNLRGVGYPRTDLLLNIPRSRNAQHCLLFLGSLKSKYSSDDIELWCADFPRKGSLGDAGADLE
jgi:hypothetical protein